MTVNLGGRPSIYTDELADEICNEIASSNRGLPTLCDSHSHWPTYRTVSSWIAQDYRGFFLKYTQAKEKQADFLCDAILDIIDKPEVFYDENGNERNDVAMMRLKVDALKWQAGKLRPKKYGDKQSIEVSQVPHEDQLNQLALDHDPTLALELING